MASARRRWQVVEVRSRLLRELGVREVSHDQLVRPHENAKTLIERPLLERRIVWIERFGKDED